MTEENLNHIINLLDQHPSTEPMTEVNPSTEEIEMMRLACLVGRESAIQSAEVQAKADEDWNKFSQKHCIKPQKESSSRTFIAPTLSKYSYLWGVLSGIAASVVIVVTILYFVDRQYEAQGIVAYEAYETVNQVTFQTSSGNILSLDSKSDSSALAAMGATLDHKDTLRLSYATKTTTDEVLPPVEKHSVSTPHGQDFNLILPDGTSVLLNAESRIDYPSRFEGKDRVVHLQGEAYFEVAKDVDHPFVVETDKLRTQVLGTHFDVCSYKNESPMVALLEGSVHVSSVDNPEHRVSLQPGYSATLESSGYLQLSTIDADMYNYRKEGYFYYDDQELLVIMQELGRWYNRNVIFEDEKLMHIRMHYFCDRHDSLEEAISILNYQPLFHIRLAGNTIFIK